MKNLSNQALVRLKWFFVGLAEDHLILGFLFLPFAHNLVGKINIGLFDKIIEFLALLN